MMSRREALGLKAIQTKKLVTEEQEVVTRQPASSALYRVTVIARSRLSAVPTQLRRDC